MKWTLEANAAWQDLKAYLSSVPTLVAPRPQELLLLYLAATNQVVSAALVAQREVEETATSANPPSRKESEPSPTRLDVDQDKEELGRSGNLNDAARKKVV